MACFYNNDNDPSLDRLFSDQQERAILLRLNSVSGFKEYNSKCWFLRLGKTFATFLLMLKTLGYVALDGTEIKIALQA